MMTAERGTWSAKLACTGTGNEGTGCGATVAIEQGDVFNSRTYARPIATVECPRCEAWTDLGGEPWPGASGDLRPLVRRRHPAAPHS